MNEHEEKLELEADEAGAEETSEPDSSDEPEGTDEWDGTESEFVEDDDAEEYEEKYSGIRLSYTLRREEVAACMKHVGFCKNGGTRQIVELCLLAALAAMFFAMYALTGVATNLFLGTVAAVMMVAVLLVPVISLNVNAEKMTTGKQLDVAIYPDNIEVRSGQSKWDIALDGSSKFEEFEKMLLVYMPQEKIFIIPLRAVEPDFLADVQAMIVAGTTPKTDD